MAFQRLEQGLGGGGQNMSVGYNKGGGYNLNYVQPVKTNN